MRTKEFFIENLQGELTRAFKWMADATEYAKKGDFQMATYTMTNALQYWIKCQHTRDRFISDEDAEKIHWDFFTHKALELAKKEKQEEEKGE